jgi:hypothetical protein
MAEVATTKLFENDRVIVWEMLLEPGESTGLHTHHRDYFFHVLEGSTLGTRDKDGVPLGDFDLDAGSTNWLALEGDELAFGDIRLPATHDAENVGSRRYREILVELK